MQRPADGRCTCGASVYRRVATGVYHCMTTRRAWNVCGNARAREDTRARARAGGPVYTELDALHSIAPSAFRNIRDVCDDYVGFTRRAYRPELTGRVFTYTTGGRRVRPRRRYFAIIVDGVRQLVNITQLVAVAAPYCGLSPNHVRRTLIAALAAYDVVQRRTGATTGTHPRITVGYTITEGDAHDE